MDKDIFTEVYTDAQFRAQIEGLLKDLFRKNKRYFDDSGLDLEDFIQEIWCELFEEEHFTPDRAWCYHSMKCNGYDYCRDLKRRYEIAPSYEYTENESDED